VVSGIRRDYFAFPPSKTSGLTNDHADFEYAFPIFGWLPISSSIQISVKYSCPWSDEYRAHRCGNGSVGGGAGVRITVHLAQFLRLFAGDFFVPSSPVALVRIVKLIGRPPYTTTLYTYIFPRYFQIAYFLICSDKARSRCHMRRVSVAIRPSHSHAAGMRHLMRQWDSVTYGPVRPGEGRG
jgi:hypothetical protein